MTSLASPRPVRLVDVVRLAGLLACGVLSGGMVVLLVLDIELGRSAELYMRYRQATTGPLTALLPPIGVAAALTTGATVVLEGRRRAPLVALFCLLVGLVTTVTVHFPLNDAIVAWPEPPADWMQVRDHWRAAHVVRTVAGVVAFVLLAVDLRRHPTGVHG
jgi:Domain of unknown function (DUF1772)